MPKFSKSDKNSGGISKPLNFVSPKKNQGKKLIKRKRKKSLKIAGKSLPALQAVVTGSIDPLTLPPSVQGPLRGTLVVTLGQVDWRLPVNPPDGLAIRLRWWGEPCNKTLYPPILHEGQILQSTKTTSLCSVNYAIKSGPKQFKTYLVDTGSLMLDAIEESSKSKKIIGQGSLINVESLLEKDFITDIVPLYDNTRRHIANLRIKAKLTMIGVVQKEPHFDDKFEMIPSALQDGFPIPSLRKPKPTKQLKIPTPDPDLVVSPVKEESFEESPIPFKPHKPKPRLYKRTEFEDVKTLVNTTEKEPGFESSNPLSLLIEKGETLRKNMVESILESHEKLNQYQFPSSAPNPYSRHDNNTNLTEIDTVIGLLLPEDPTQAMGGEQDLPGDYNQFLEESLVRDSSLIEDILYCNNTTMGRTQPQMLDIPFDDPIIPLELEILQQQIPSLQEEILIQEIETPLETQKIIPPKTDTLPQQERENSEQSYALIRDRLGIDRITELGRVFAARVQIGKLIFNSPMETLNAPTTPTQISRIYRCTYIVEYQLDQQETPGIRKRATRRPEESVRVITRKVDGEGNIVFNHRTVVPLCLTGGIIRKWWNSKIEFKIYKKNLGQKKAIYLGVATILLRDLLDSDNLELSETLQVCVPSHLQKDQHPTQLYASIELASEPAHNMKKVKEFKESSKKDENIDSSGEPVRAVKEKHVRFAPSPSHTQEEYPSTDEESINSYESDNSPTHIPTDNAIRLHLLLMVSDGTEISVSQKKCPWRGVNPYLVAKMFCADPSPQSTVHWENASPNFAFRQLFPVQLTPDVLSQRMCNKVVVVEVWHRETNRNRAGDELIGLVQLSLHQFYISFTHPENTTQSLQGQYPIVSENGCYPITDPLTGKSRGFISALLALGSLEQMSRLEQNITEGNFNFKTTDKMQNKCKGQQDVTTPLFLSQEGSFPVSASDHVFSEDSEHVFEICIDGAKDVHPLGSGVWGETDCYISYKFPISTRADQDPAQYTTNDEAELTTFTTPTTLSLPCPNFSAHHTHRLYLRRGSSLQQILLDSTYQGMRRDERNVDKMSWRPQIEFELWRRYYYPDTQNHLLARGYLPTAKVCEMVTLVQHEGSFTVRTFTVPMHLAENEQSLSTHYTDNTNCGQLDLTVRYKLVKLDPEYSPSDPTATTSRSHPQIFVKLQIKQATGLKDALELAAKSNTNISRYELETGCNTYVMVRLSFSKKTHCTKAIAATFSPIFSYEIEIPLSLSQSVIDTHSPVSLAETLSKSTLIFQLWHVPMPEDISPRNKPQSGMPHVIIAECTLPFEMLIVKSTGIRGWYTLKPPNGKGSKCVGALEVTVEFSSIEEREKVMYEANKFGYQIERPVKFDALQLEAETNLEIDINIRRLWLAKLSTQNNKTFCYLRYRFYDKQTTFSPTFSVRRNEGNRFVYDLDYKKSCQVFPSSALEWYLQEERLEVQIWLTNTKSNVPIMKPNVDDFLIGTAYVNLFEMCGFREYQEPQLSGVFPLFKPGSNSLGGSCLEIEISMHPPTEIEILETSLQNKSILTQNQSVGADVREEVPTGIQVILSIESAAHLSTLPDSAGFLQATVHSDSLLFRTEKIETSMSPVWNCQQEVRIDEEIFSPMVGIEVKLWYSATIDTAHSQLIGVAKVDLSPLKYGLPELSGWYNISNVMSSCQGQIKVRATPRERLNIPSSVKVQQQKLEWKRKDLCSLIDNPINLYNPIVIQDVEVDISGVPDVNATGSFLMRRLKSSLADLDHVQANLNQIYKPPETTIDTPFEFDERNCPSLSPVDRILNERVESECIQTEERLNTPYLSEQIESEITDNSHLTFDRLEQASDDGHSEAENILPQDMPDTHFVSEQLNMDGNDPTSLISRDYMPEIVGEDEFHPTYSFEEKTKSLDDTSEEVVPVQHTMFQDINTHAFTETENLDCRDNEAFSIADTEEPYAQQTPSPRNLSPNLFDTEEIIQQFSTENNITHHFLETFSNVNEGNPEVCYSPKSLTDISQISDTVEPEEKSEDILKWVDEMTKNTYNQTAQNSNREERSTRILELEPDGTIKMNIPEDMEVPNFFMPPDTLIQNMRSLRLNAFNKFPQEGVKEKSPPPQPKKPAVHLTTPLLPWEANRINKIFLGKV